MNAPVLPRHASRSLALGAAGFCASISWQVVVPVLPLHLAHLGYSPAEIGLVISVFSLTMGLVELQAGAVVAVIGRRWSILLGYVANAVCLTIAAVAHARALVAGSLAAVGAARGVLVPPLHATVADSAGAEARGRAFGIFWMFASLAALTGPAIGGFAAGHHGDRAPFVLGALFSLAALPVIAAQPMPGRATRGVSFGELAALLSDASTARLGVSIFLTYSVAGIWTTFLPLYASHQGASVVAIGWIFAIQGGMNALMQIPTGRLVSQEYRRWLAPAGIVLMSATEASLPLLRHTPLLLAAGAPYGIAVGILPVTFAVAITRRVPPERYTAALSVFNSAIDLGLFAGPLLGAAAARVNIAAPFLLALPVGLAAAAMSMRPPSPSPEPAPAAR